MRSGRAICATCGQVSGRVSGCPTCGYAEPVDLYDSLRRSGLVVRRKTINRARQRALAAFLAIFGALLALVGQAGDESALTALGAAIVICGMIYAFAADAVGLAAGFANSRAGRLTICAALLLITVLVLSSQDAVALLR